MQSQLPDISLWPGLMLSGGDLLPWMAWHVAKEALADPARGPAWLRSVVLSDRACDVAIAVSSKFLRNANDDATVAATARVLITSKDRWARFSAAEALRGPWAATAAESLLLALLDTRVLLDMWAVHRVSDAAAIALTALGRTEDPAFQRWRTRTEADLTRDHSDERQLAVFVLAQLNHGPAMAILQALAQDPAQWQAHEVVAEIAASQDSA